MMRDSGEFGEIRTNIYIYIYIILNRLFPFLFYSIPHFGRIRKTSCYVIPTILVE